MQFISSKNCLFSQNDRPLASDEDVELGLNSIEDHLLNPISMTSALPPDEDLRDYIN